MKTLIGLVAIVFFSTMCWASAPAKLGPNQVRIAQGSKITLVTVKSNWKSKDGSVVIILHDSRNELMSMGNSSHHSSLEINTGKGRNFTVEATPLPFTGIWSEKGWYYLVDGQPRFFSGDYLRVTSKNGSTTVEIRKAGRLMSRKVTKGKQLVFLFTRKWEGGPRF